MRGRAAGQRRRLAFLAFGRAVLRAGRRRVSGTTASASISTSIAGSTNFTSSIAMAGGWALNTSPCARPNSSQRLASAGDEWSHTRGKNKMSGRSATLFVRKDGKWLVKAMVEGGWGDAMKQPAPGAAGEGGAAPGTPAGGGTGGAAGSGQPQ